MSLQSVMSLRDLGNGKESIVEGIRMSKSEKRSDIESEQKEKLEVSQIFFSTKFH